MTTAALQPQQSNIWWIFLLQGIAGIILGLMLLTDPGATMVALVTFLGFYWLIMGILALVRVFVDRSIPWIWSLLIGIIGVLAGIFVVKHPLLAALTVPTMIVIILGLQGLAMGVLEIIGGFAGGGIGSFILGGLCAGRLATARLSDGSGAGGATGIRRAPSRAGRRAHHIGIPRPSLRCATLGLELPANAACTGR